MLRIFEHADACRADDLHHRRLGRLGQPRRRLDAVRHGDDAIAARAAKFRGHYLHGSHVVLSYTVGGVGVLDTVTNETGDGSPIVARTLELAPTKER